jgi:hypothetical protein
VLALCKIYDCANYRPFSLASGAETRLRALSLLHRGSAIAPQLLSLAAATVVGHLLTLERIKGVIRQFSGLTMQSDHCTICRL